MYKKDRHLKVALCDFLTPIYWASTGFSVTSEPVLSFYALNARWCYFIVSIFWA